MDRQYSYVLNLSIWYCNLINKAILSTPEDKIKKLNFPIT